MIMMIVMIMQSPSQDGWNRGKFGPIDKFIMYFENIEREKAPGQRARRYARRRRVRRRRAPQLDVVVERRACLSSIQGTQTQRSETTSYWGQCVSHVFLI